MPIGVGVDRQGLAVTRAETSDQGSGEAASLANSGAYNVRRTTSGGSYLRRFGSSAGVTHFLNAGLHGKPNAVQ